MMDWFSFAVLGLVIAGLGAAMMREPGVRLYDWFATHARRPKPEVRLRIPEGKPEASAQTG